MTHPPLQSHHPNTHHAAPTTDREIARPMPRFDHMKGEVSVKNLVWRQGGKQLSLGGLIFPHLQPHQCWLLKQGTSCLPKVHTPGSWGWGGGGDSNQGRKAAERQLLGESSPCPPLPCHIKAEAQVKNGVADPCSSEKKKGVRGCSLERGSQLRRAVAALLMGYLLKGLHAPK